MPLVDDTTAHKLRHLKGRLHHAVRNRRSSRWCLSLWGRFIRNRDANRCVACRSTSRIQAHHIFRRSLYPRGWYELGNGITLCHDCHREPHGEFNGRPDVTLPLGAQGGDDQDLAARLYGALLEDANDRRIEHDEFYFIRNKMLQFFVAVQGYEDLYWAVQEGRMSRLQMACEIWRVMPETWYARFARQSIVLNLDSGGTR